MIGALMISCSKVSKLFEGGAGIHELTLDFSPGRIYGIIGANGAGKTTLFRCLEGLYHLSSGSITYDAVSTTDNRQFSLKRKHIAYLPTEDFLYPKLTCAENISLGTILRTGSERLLPETKQLIDYFEIGSYLQKPFGQCSTGMKKKVQIITSLAGHIETVIWDEPNNGIDILANIQMKKLLKQYRQQGKTIIISSHVIEFLDCFIDRCIIMHEGRIADERESREIQSLQDHYIRILNSRQRCLVN
jgi:ABC-type multidrug transport system ATPase subunit